MSLPRSEILLRFKTDTINVLPRSAEARALSPIVRRAKRIIDERFAGPLTLEGLAAAVGRSKRQLASLFQQQLAMSVHEYLTRVRLRRKLDLIRKDEKIEVVSLEHADLAPRARASARGDAPRSVRSPAATLPASRSQSASR